MTWYTKNNTSWQGEHIEPAWDSLYLLWNDPQATWDELETGAEEKIFYTKNNSSWYTENE